MAPKGFGGIKGSVSHPVGKSLGDLTKPDIRPKRKAAENTQTTKKIADEIKATRKKKEKKKEKDNINDES
jgi:hypothetical protein